MRKMKISEFKEKCLSIIDNLDPEGLVITKHGKVVAKIVPFSSDHHALIGALKGKIKIKGDIFSTGMSWNAKS